ncbi:hypothetical protein CEXT_188091 [Caerostris extrusa]|uniref:Uncharacterized protein n=1 Tax=Caerostris extrusa TaxID=172846 RepID=A0AAV4QZ72_CAEEX|nr:hypothetical protein CEXT_188091 [Caerostris extrusa]
MYDPIWMPLQGEQRRSKEQQRRHSSRGATGATMARAGATATGATGTGAMGATGYVGQGSGVVHLSGEGAGVLSGGEVKVVSS